MAQARTENIFMKTLYPHNVSRNAIFSMKYVIPIYVLYSMRMSCSERNAASVKHIKRIPRAFSAYLF